MDDIPFELLTIEACIITILSFTFCLLASVVLIYYVRRRYLLHFEIKSISQDELMLQSFQNHRKNLRIKALISNFIIIIVLLEIVYNLFLFFAYLLFSIIAIHFDINSVEVLERLVVFNNYLNLISYQCHLPILCMFLKVLWLIYLHSPYKYTIIRWTWYIVVRCVVFSIDDYFLTSNLLPIHWYTPLFIINEAIFSFVYISDFIIYLVYARRLYIQLKSREKEARWFKDRAEYRTARSLRLHYKIATILVAIAMCSITISRSRDNFVIIILNFVSSNLFNLIRDYFNLRFTYIVYIFQFNLNYLYIVSMMVFQYCKQKRQLTNVNKKIKPIVKNYHDTLYYRRC